MQKNDAIFTFTRIVAAIVIPFLWVAFLILFFMPDQTGQRFAWAIKPHLTSLYIGAGYFGGSWLFVNTLFGKRWHRVHGGFPPITIFTWYMLIATLLHWGRFSHGTLGFYAWVILYIITPFLVPAIWLYNRRTDPGTPETSDVMAPSALLWVLRIVGSLVVLFSIAGFLYPSFFIGIWPWTLTPLTARVMSGWVVLLGVGALTLSTDPRWSAWRVPAESFVIWHVLVLVAFYLEASNFTTGPLNWFTVTVALLVAGLVLLYVVMERQRRKAA